MSRIARPALAAVLWICLAAAPTARADEFLNKANQAVRKVGDEKRSDLILLPLLPALQPAPAVLTGQYQAALFGALGPAWAEAEAWARAEPQKAVIDAFETITKEDNDPQKGFVFGLPYGADAAGPELVTREMHVELGDPPTLAAAKFLYMDRLETAAVLMHVEASRLAAAGDNIGAMDKMKQLLLFGRQMADRPFLKEKKWGMETMLLALERMCDLGYVDFRADKHITEPSRLRDLISLLRDRSLYIDRIRLPVGDFIAREQLISRVLVEKGGANADTFGPTMARISAVDRPLRLFSSAAFWDQARAAHAGWYETNDKLTGLRDDWERRWSLSPFDRVLQNTRSYWDLSIANKPRFAVVGSGLQDVPALFTLRRRIEAYQAGTRMALAAYTFFLREKVLPRTLAAATPAIIRSIDKDPYSSRGEDIQYFIPEIDNPADARGDARLHEIRLFPPPPRPELRITLDRTHFVVYSCGPDDRRELARECTQGQEGKPGDYLFWPPELSLLRQHMIDNGEME